MRIFHTESSVNLGGKELRIVEEIEWFQRHGHHIQLAAAEDSGIYRAAKSRRLDIVPIKFRGSLNLSVIKNLLTACRKHRSQLIVTHDSRDTSNVWPVAAILRLPVIRWQNICKPLKDDLAHKFVWRHAANEIVAASESIRQRLLQQHLAEGRKISVLGEFVDTKLFNPETPTGDVRARHGIPKDATLIVHIGMIRPDKGQRILVEAADKILRAHPDCWFMFVGAPTRPDFLEALKERVRGIRHPERIVFAGFQENVAPYFASADIVCMTSLIEAQSKIIPQAFAMKRLVVAPNVGGIPELIRHRENGLLYRGGDSDALATAVNEALAGNSEILAERGYELAQMMDINRIMSQTEKLYESWIYDTALDSSRNVSSREPKRGRFHHRERGEFSPANGMAAAGKLSDARRRNFFVRLARRISSAAALLRHHV